MEEKGRRGPGNLEAVDGGGRVQEEESTMLRDSASFQMERQGYTKEPEKEEENTIHRLQRCKAELQLHHKQDLLKIKETCVREMQTKYKDDLEKIIKDLIAANFEVDIQTLKNIVINLNEKLQASSPCKEVETFLDNLLTEFSETDVKYNILIEELLLQLTKAEERAREAEASKQEKEFLNEEIEKLNSFVQKLSNKLFCERERNINLSCKYESEISTYNKKLKDLIEEKTLLLEVLEIQKSKVDEMSNKLCQSAEELQLVDKEIVFSRGFRIDNMISMLEDAKQNLNKIKVPQDSQSFESDNCLKENVEKQSIITDDTDKLSKCLLRQKQVVIFNCSECSDLGNAVQNTVHFGDVLGPSNNVSFCSFDEEICCSMPEETLNKSKLSAEAMLSFSSECNSSQNEEEERQDVGDSMVDLVERDSDLFEQIKEKEVIFEKALKETQENGSTEVSIACLEGDLNQKMDKNLEQEHESNKGENNDLAICIKCRGTMQALTCLTWEEMVKDLQQEKEVLMMQLRVQEQLVKDVQEQKTVSDSIEELNAEIREKMDQQQQLEVDRKEQIGIIKKVHEREHDREICELIVQHENEMKELHTQLMKEQQQLLDDLRQQMETKHQEETKQVETTHNLKLEALRLSLNNIHASQLELTQTNLRKEKETALMELREMLNDKHAQEVAVLQGQYHFELECIKERHKKEKEEMALEHQHEKDKEKEKTMLELDKKHILTLENLKREWMSNADQSLKHMADELSGKHQIELKEIKSIQKAEIEEIKGKLESLAQEKEQAEMEHKNLENQYRLSMAKLQDEHEKMLKNVREQSKKQEEGLQEETQKLKAVLEKLKIESEKEINQLRSQLDNAQAYQQELNELKEELAVRTSHIEEMEHLKLDFQLKWDKQRNEHENELEQLRLYFEQKLKSLEESYREELTMLHQRLQEVKDYSYVEMENNEDQHVEFCLSTMLLEEMTEKERRKLFEQLIQKVQHYKEELVCLQLNLEKNHRSELELLKSSLTVQYQESLTKMKMDLSDRYASEIEELKRKQCLNLEQLRAKLSEEHLREITKLRLQSAQDAARQVEMEVAERLLTLENEYKAKMDVLQAEVVSVSAQKEETEKLKKENTKLKEMNACQKIHFKEELEQIKCKLIGDHASELKKSREEVQKMEQTHKAKAEEWKQEQENLKRKTAEEISVLHNELENKAKYQKEALEKQFQLREAELLHLQEQQAARIVELEKSLKEQQNSVWQLEDSLVNAQKTLTQYDNELSSTKAQMAEKLEKTKHLLQEEWKAKLEDAKSRTAVECKEIAKKVIREHEILLQELKEKHTDELEHQRKALQHKYEEQMLSLTSDLQAKHQAEMDALRCVLERQQQTLETQVTDMQDNQKAQIMELETKHLSHLETLESTYISEIQLLREEHRQALEDLQTDFKEQLLQKDKANEMLLSQMNEIKLQHAEELQNCQDTLKIELAAAHIEKLKIMAAELEEAHKEDLIIALEKQKCLLEKDCQKTLDGLREKIIYLEEQHKTAIQKLQDIHIAEMKKEKESFQQLQKQLEEKNNSLNNEIEDASAEVKSLLEQRNRENREGETLISLLRSDIESCNNERKKLQEHCQQALKLLLKMVKAAKDTEEVICKKTGFCLNDSLASGDSGACQSVFEETVLSRKSEMTEKWDKRKNNTVNQGQDLDQTVTDSSFDYLVPNEVTELSEHLCDSIFENPELVFENEERINKISLGLHCAVEKVLQLVDESCKQLEETHKMHLHFEEELKHRSWEACQVITEHHELMECLNEESEGKDQLVLELHKARGLFEGYLAERNALEEALNLKEESEHRLIVELESLKSQVQQLTQQYERSVEDQKLLMNQNKALAANVGEREVELLKEIEDLAKAKLELQCQAEKDCSTLNGQLKILEMELEEQLNRNQKVTAMSLEITDLKQQIQALERQLKSQQNFINKQAVEWEHERDEFQEEIQKLEMQLKIRRSHNSRELVVESCQNEIKDKKEDYKRLSLNKEQMEKDLAFQKGEIEKLESRIRELEHKNSEEATNVNKLTQELQKMKKMESELRQDNEALQQQHYNNLIQISALQSKLDEARHKMLGEGSLNHAVTEELKTNEELEAKKREIANLLEQLEQFNEKLMDKNEENFQLNSKLELEKNINAAKIIQLQEENALLKALEKQIFETEILKSDMESLDSNKDQLKSSKPKETEVTFLGPRLHEVSGNQDNLNIFSPVELEENPESKLKEETLNYLKTRDKCTSNLLLNSSQKQPLGQLDIVVEEKETLPLLLTPEESQVKTEINIPEQSIQDSSSQHFSELVVLQLQYKELQEEHKLMKMCLIQRDIEMAITTSKIEELETKVKERDTKLMEREQQLQTALKQKEDQAAEVKHLKDNVVQLENELHALVQTLNTEQATHQTEMSKLEVAIGELGSRIEKNREEQEALRCERDLFHSQLNSFMEEANDQEVQCSKLEKEPESFVPSKKVEEGGEEGEPLNNKDELAKHDTMLNLESPNESQNIQEKNLQGMILTQGREKTNTVEEQQDLQSLSQQILQLNHLFYSTQLSKSLSDDFQNAIRNSPELMRKENNNVELQASLPFTPLSESDEFESLCSEFSETHGDNPGFMEFPISCSNGSEEAAGALFQSSHSSPGIPISEFPGPTFSQCDGIQEHMSVSDVESLILMPSKLQDDLISTMSGVEVASTDHDINNSSDTVLQLNQEDPEVIVPQHNSLTSYFQLIGMVPEVSEQAMKEKVFSQQLKNVLKMVHEESYKILILSEKAVPANDDINVQLSQSVEGWQKDRLTLLDTIQSLRNYLNKLPDKENAPAFFDWRGELIQAVQCVLEKERNMLQSYLQSHFRNPGSGDEGSLVEKLERIVEQQEQQQKVVLEHLLSSDRNSLLTEIQDLEAQLRLMHLQSQEKLQQLQETLISTENHQSKQEHQLRRQVELLEYKLQQEKSIAADLQASLKTEQEKASEMHELLKQEHTVIFNLKSDLSESKQTNEKLQKTLQELQQEVIKYSSALENTEKGMAVVLQDLQNEQIKEQEIQRMLDEHQQQHKIKEEEKSKAIEELQAALELQCIQNNQLSVALEHEQIANSNLRKELQIEQSRCEALLSQDHNKLLELQKNIDIEKKRNLELLHALNHERVLTEQLSMRVNEYESSKHKDTLQKLQTQLYLEKSHTKELLAIIEKTQQQVLSSKTQMGEIRIYCEEPQKEQDHHHSLQASLQKQQNNLSLEGQTERDATMKRKWESVHGSLRDQQNRREQPGRERKQEHQTACDKQKEPQETEEIWNTGRIKELQQILEDLKEQERYLLCHKYQFKFPSSPSKHSSNLTFTTDTVMLQVEQQKLENIREQLLFAAAHLSKLLCRSVNRTAHWSSASDEVVAALLHILEELQAELAASSKPSLIPSYIVSTMQESEGTVSREKKMVVHNGWKGTEYEATKTNYVMRNKSTIASSNLKMQKLHRKYLRAESFRKALVYQKKYLLLLLGGFQECEQATLALIARMGIYPSPPEMNACRSRNYSFTKFRSAVRVVIAISRLKFLVRKWHKVGGKEMHSEAISANTGHNSDIRDRIEVMKQQAFQGDLSQETGYCSRSNFITLGDCSPKLPWHLHNRLSSSASQCSSRDPEHSLTEYIAHLEAIQQRLGTAMPGYLQHPEKP